MDLFEFVTADTVVMRHPHLEKAIRRFFADAGKNSVKAFRSETRLGYVFFDPDTAAKGKFFQLVLDIKEADVSKERFDRQFSHAEWFVGIWSGKLDMVAAIKPGEELPE